MNEAKPNPDKCPHPARCANMQTCEGACYRDALKSIQPSDTGAGK